MFCHSQGARPEAYGHTTLLSTLLKYHRGDPLPLDRDRLPLLSVPRYSDRIMALVSQDSRVREGLTRGAPERAREPRPR